MFRGRQLAFVLLAWSLAAQADPMGMNQAMCRSPQYFECFGVTKAQCQEKAELPFAYCYRALGIRHPMTSQLKPLNVRLNGRSGIDIGKCGEATYYYMNESSLIKNDKCDKLMTVERKRWSAEIMDFAAQARDASK